MSVYFHFLQNRQIVSANHITMIHPTLHPDRMLKEHDFLYMLDGTWEIGEEYPTGGPKETFRMRSDDLLILPAGRHHYGISPCSPHNRHMYIHVKPLSEELTANTDASIAASAAPGPPPDGLTAFSSLIHCQDAPRIRSLFEEIISESWTDSDLKEQKLSLLFNLLLCELQEQQEKGESLSGAVTL